MIMLEEARLKVMLPLRVSLNYMIFRLKPSFKLKMYIKIKEALNDNKQAGTKWETTKKRPKGNTDALQQRVIQSDNALPVYSHLFDNYRLKCTRKIIKDLIFTEMRYHCQIIEELSPILEMLYNIPDVSS
jgi:hypothetical protein